MELKNPMLVVTDIDRSVAFIIKFLSLKSLCILGQIKP